MPECSLLKRTANALLDVGFAPIAPEMSRRIGELAAMENTPRYGLTWTYVTQAVNGHATGLSPLGYILFRDSAFIAANAFHRPLDGMVCVHFVTPKSFPASTNLGAIAAEVQARTPHLPIYLKKAPSDLRQNALSQGFRRVSLGDVWHVGAPWEDDTIPERILPIGAAFEATEHSSSEIANKTRRFARKTEGKRIAWIQLEEANAAAAMGVINSFFDYKLERHIDISVPTDYSNMVYWPARRDLRDLIRQVLLCDEDAIAVLILERLNSSNVFGLYCNLCLYRRHPYLSEYVMMHAVREAAERGATALYLGGSETAGLDSFKEKFGAYQAVDAYEWLIRDP
jgi:hypothetical protein